MVSIYRACLKSGKTLVADVYTAHVLDVLSDFAALPAPTKGFSNLLVFFPNRLTTGLFKRGYGEMANRFAKFKITREELSAQPADFVMLVRPSMQKDMERIRTNTGNLIYSMWEGYLEQPSTLQFIDWLKSRNFTFHAIHTSGHADPHTLREFTDALDPKMIVPIHTFHKHDYQKLFTQQVKVLEDNEKLYL